MFLTLKFKRVNINIKLANKLFSYDTWRRGELNHAGDNLSWAQTGLVA